MAVKELGHAGVSSGWRKALADRVTPPVARRTPFDADAVRAALGIGFVAISTLYLARALRGALKR